MNGIAICFLCLFVYAPLVTYQAPPPPKEPLRQEEVFVRIQDNVKNIQKVKLFLEQVKSASPLLSKISSNANALNDVVTRRKIKLTREYLMSLTLDAFALQLIAYELKNLKTFDETSTQKVVRRLQEVASDLELKFRYINKIASSNGDSGNRSSNHASLVFRGIGQPDDLFFHSKSGIAAPRMLSVSTQLDDLPALEVDVIVNTRDSNGTVVNGYAVWYVPNFLEDSAEFYNSFGSLTSPMKKSLAVGNYKMWTRAPDGSLGEKTPVNPGDDNKKEMRVDLLIPRGVQDD